MARFVFRLEGLLEARRRDERECQRGVAECRAVVVEIERQITAGEAEVRESMELVRQMHLGGKIDLAFLAAHRRFAAAMQRRGVALGQKLAAARAKLAEAQVRLVEAAKRRKAIEKLRERQMERWRLDLEQKERRELDEIGMRLAFEDQQAAHERGKAQEVRA